MITFDSVTKQFPDGTVAVDDLSLEIGEGEIAVFVGPSGCGKTTTLRMVNRMIEPSSGTITVDGNDIMSQDPPELRRGIGYVIQQIGLFPHRTISENVATVPKLEGWDDDKTKGRVEELIEVVGLPSNVADRYPHQLSGGQRQRVGVARALAADPPVMLMDEPFGAVDPIVRSSLQEEFLRLQREVQKTIVFVTHDIDEAIKMGDKIAILKQGGSLEQYDTPTAILAEPANDFVEDFLGAERGLKRLALIPVSDVAAEEGPVVTPGDDIEAARKRAAEHNLGWVVMLDDDRRLLGWVGTDALDGHQSLSQLEPKPFQAKVAAKDSLRAALNAVVTTHTGVAVRVSEGDHYEGMITRELLTEELL
ncbi:MAG: ABC transporter ATP-binding protein [Egibacteraceae bacterium]